MALDGENNEVRVILNGEEAFIVKRYSVSMSVMQVPAKFTLSLGNGDLAKDLKKRYPAGTPFELQIARTTQFIGKTDGYAISPSDGTTIELMGRDSLAPLHDAYVPAEKTYSDVSFLDITKTALDATVGAGNYTLVATDDATQKAYANTTAKGKTVKSAKKLQAQKKQGGTADPVPEDAKALEDFDTSIFTAGAQSANRKLQAKLGMRWYAEFLKPQLNRAGLFLWALGNGDFVLTPIDAKRAPITKIRHRRGAIDNVVVAYNHRNDTSLRYSRCKVWGRRGNGKETRTQISGEYVDQEMVDLGFDRPMVIEDDKVTTIEQAQFLARRRIAETRRDGWTLSYTLAGHTTTTLDGYIGIWVPGITVDVDDAELGISGPHYIHTVEHSGEPHMQTTISLMRPEDAVFGEED